MAKQGAGNGTLITVIEYAPQGGGGNGTGLGGAATNLHIHGVYRDPINDYGAKYAK